jgi:hypothetical protein
MNGELSKTRRVFQIFLASPSDVSAERDVVRQIVNEVNRVVAPMCGLAFEVYGWEEEVPGMGRPQDHINPHADDCDLFIGLLWKRWGQSTGTFSSGFEEELNRALQRHRTTRKPEIWIGLRDVSEEDSQDAGPQLAAVLKFRAELKARNELLYATFVDPVELGGKLREWLQRLAFRLASAVAELAPSGPPGMRVATRDSAPQTGEIDEGVSVELRSATERFLATMNGTAKEYVDAGVELSHFDLLRMQLASTAWLWNVYGGEGLDTHAINLLYQFRDQVSLTFPELRYLLDAIVGDSNDLLAGWYWFRAMPDFAVKSNLEYIALFSPKVATSARAIDLITSLATRLQSSTFLRLCERAASSESRDLGRSLGEYTAVLGDEQELGQLTESSVITSSLLAREVADVRLRVLSRTNPAALPAAVADLDASSSTLVARLFCIHQRTLGTAVLRSLLRNSAGDVRASALGVLVERDALDVADLRSLENDDSRQVRALAIEGLIKLGQTITTTEVRERLADPASNNRPLFVPTETVDPEPLLKKVLSREDETSLRARIGWLAPDGPLAYTELGLAHFDKVAGQIRRDLDDGFKTLRESSASVLAAFAAATGESAASQAGLDNFIRGQYVTAALQVLAERGRPNDVGYARQYAHRGALFDMTPVIRLLKRFGSASDSIALVALSDDTRVDNAVQAALTAVALESAAATALLSSAHERVVGVALLSLKGKTVGDLLPLVEPLLSSSREGTRVRATALLVEELENDELEALLQRYRSGETYFYDVGCWLDRCVYAPNSLRRMYAAKIAGILRDGVSLEDENPVGTARPDTPKVA